MKKQGLIVIGDGGHALSVVEVIESTKNFYVEGYVSKGGEKSGALVDYVHLGTDSDLPELFKMCSFAVIGIGISQSLEGRMLAFQNLVEIGFTVPTLVAENSYVAKSATLGEGTIVFNGVVINSQVSIGSNCVVNSKALLEHEVVVRDGSFISTGVVVNGNTKIGQNTLIGSGSVIRENLTIGDRCTIGMGSVLLEDLSSEQVFIQRENRR